MKKKIEWTNIVLYLFVIIYIVTERTVGNNALFDFVSALLLVFGLLLILITIFCDKSTKQMENPLTQYEPSYFIGKNFIYGGYRFRIDQYDCLGQAYDDRMFKCLDYRTGYYIDWYEDELRKAISKNEVE